MVAATLLLSLCRRCSFLAQFLADHFFRNNDVIPIRLHFPALARPPVFTVSAPNHASENAREERKDGTTTKRRNVRTGGRNYHVLVLDTHGRGGYGYGYRGVSLFV